MKLWLMSQGEKLDFAVQLKTNYQLLFFILKMPYRLQQCDCPVPCSLPDLRAAEQDLHQGCQGHKLISGCHQVGEAQ